MRCLLSPAFRTGCLMLILTTAQPVMAQSLDSLGYLPSATSSIANGVSADGSVVVGYGIIGTKNLAFRWTQANGLVTLGDLPGGQVLSQAFGVNADGSIIVGQSWGTNGIEAFRWTQADGMIGLGHLTGGSSSKALGISADGNVIVGDSTSAIGQQAFRWTQADGMIGLGMLTGGSFSTAFAANADGSVVIGDSSSSSGTQAFRWTQAGGMVGLGDLPGGPFQSDARAVSADGSVVVGVSNSTNGAEAFRWTQATGMVGLGDLPGGAVSSLAYGVSANGNVIVGSATDASGLQAFRWTQATGMKSIADLLTAGGVDLTGWKLSQAKATNADGSVIVGQGTKDKFPAAFIAKVGGSNPGVTTPQDLANSLASSVVPSQQGQQLMTAGLGQSLFAARYAASAIPLRRQEPSVNPDSWPRFSEPSLYSAYAVGSLGVGQDNNRDNWGLNGTTGLLAHVAPGLHIGAGVVAGHNETELDLGGESRLGALGGSVIAAYEAPEGPRLYGSAFIAHLDVETERHYANGAGVDHSTGTTSGIGYGLVVRGGWQVPVQVDTAITPYAGLEWSWTKLNGYAETGGAFPAEFSDQTAYQLISRLGAEVSHQLTATLKVQAEAAWAHRLDGDGGSLTATTLGLTGTLSGTEGDRNWVEGALAAIWQVTDTTQLSAQIGGRSGETVDPAVDAKLGVYVRL